jgi:hypothetical protein
MAQTALGNLGLNYEHTLGTDDWKNSYDANWVISDSVGGQPFIIDSTILAEPGAPAVGDAYILPTGTKTGTNWGSDSGVATNVVALYTALPGQADSSPWLYLTPREGWRVYDRTNNVEMFYDGAKWIREGKPKGQVHILGDNGGDYTLGSLDANALLGLSAAFDFANDDVVVPQDATYDFPIGTKIVIHNDSSGVVQITDGASVTWHDEDPTTWAGLPPQSWITIEKWAANTWALLHVDLRQTHNTDVTGFSGTVNIDVRLRRMGEILSMRVPTITGTSNTTAMAFNTAIPVAFRPTNTHANIARVEDNTGGQVLGIATIPATGVVAYGVGLANSAFTASGTKGADGLTFGYNRA